MPDKVAGGTVGARPRVASGGRPTPITPSPDGDWPAQAADAIVNAVGKVEEKVTGPIQTVATGIVWGFFAFLLAVPTVVLLCVLQVRFLDAYLPDSVFGEHHVWAVYLIDGALFLAAGWWLWRKAKQAAARDG